MAFPGKLPAYALGRTGSHYVQLLKVGLAPNQARFLVENTAYAAGYSKAHGFSKTQARTLASGDFSMAALLKGKFTRPQAVVIRRMMGL